MNVAKRLPVRVAFLLALLLPQAAEAFYDWQTETASAELRGFLSASAIALSNPDNALIYYKRNISSAALSGRVMLDASHENGFSFEAHLAQDYVPTDLRSGGSRFYNGQGVERSSLLAWQYASGQSHLEVDRLNIQYNSARLTAKLGRQPVNLSATFYFTPNDFFSPFAAQTFFRAYKPGVDAARLDMQLGEQSQLSLISVMGFSSAVGRANGWSRGMDAARNAYLGRWSGVAGDFELALLAGMVRRDRVLGIDFQGEIFDGLGLRGEGHWLMPDLPGRSDSLEFSAGLDYRWPNSFTLRFEQYYHGSGATSATAYSLNPVNGGLYQARHYSAAGASYEFTPLLTGDVAAIWNWVDQSALLALYLLYSTSNESELAFTGNLSIGKASNGLTIGSEFGLYPDSVSLEYRIYF